MMIIWEGGVEVVVPVPVPVLVVPVTGGGLGLGPGPGQVQVQVQVQAVTERDPHAEEQQTSGNPLKVMSLPACFKHIELILIHKVIKRLIWCNTSFKHKNKKDIIQKWIICPSITCQQAWQSLNPPVRLPSGPGLHSQQEVGPVFISSCSLGAEGFRMCSVNSKGTEHLRPDLYVHPEGSGASCSLGRCVASFYRGGIEE